MSDDPKPPPSEPPPLPLHLVRPWTARERALDKLLQDTRAELEAERATVQVLRQQYQERATGPHEDTLPGVGASPGSVRAYQKRRRSRGAPRRRVWVPIVAALLGLAATAAGIRYPGLMGPIKDVAQALTEAFR